ncbi:MAG: hypothetical protein MJ010_08145 [Paludibacteraceae bacterium]|nr:hypothetical protein [Paludibacteraceae bacterium]
MDIDKVLESYDDDEAIKFIINTLPTDIRQQFTEDDIQYFLDVIYILDESCIIDPDEFRSKILSYAKKDEITAITPENVDYLINGEADYFKSLTLVP